MNDSTYISRRQLERLVYRAARARGFDGDLFADDNRRGTLGQEQEIIAVYLDAVAAARRTLSMADKKFVSRLARNVVITATMPEREEPVAMSINDWQRRMWRFQQ